MWPCQAASLAERAGDRPQGEDGHPDQENLLAPIAITERTADGNESGQVREYALITHSRSPGGHVQFALYQRQRHVPSADRRMGRLQPVLPRAGEAAP
jgi:uncharacterized protein (DUF885 family)